MLKSFDHIIKNALENYIAPNASDWEVFYDLLQVEQTALNDQDLVIDEDFGAMLSNLEYTGTVAGGWEAFESRLDDLNAELDQEFDQTVGEALENIPETTWGAGQWHLMSSRLDNLDAEWDQEFDQTVEEALESIPETTWGAGQWHIMSSRLDDLDAEMDQEFDQTVGEVLGNLPDTIWKESHWQMLSSRLDELNDQPRFLMMKMIEAAAILLILIQATSLYTDFQRKNGGNNSLATYFDQVFNPDNKDEKDVIVRPNSFPSSSVPESDEIAGKFAEQNQENTGQSDQSTQINSGETDRIKETAADHQGQNHTAQVKSDSSLENANIVVMQLTPSRKNQIPLNSLPDGKNIISQEDGGTDPGLLPQLSSTPPLIAYDNTPDRLMKTSPKLGVRDISLLTTTSSDSILNSIPTFQVIKPRLYSSMEVGTLADATNVDIRDSWLNINRQAYQETILNAGLYFRYKIQFKDMFGSIGSDYLRMQYGTNNKNELSMLTLPVELGYNVINLSTFRMYFSGGVAGRFVPVANYSSETLNLASGYNRTSKSASNGLLYNGPFEINSYLSGRLSMGLDINVSETTSVNLRFSHDIWLKGRGIGYNLDKFRSSHIAIGANHHF